MILMCRALARILYIFRFFHYIERRVFSALEGWNVLRPNDRFELKAKLQAVIRHVNDNEKHLIFRAMSNFIVSTKKMFGLTFSNLFLQVSTPQLFVPNGREGF